LSALPERVVEKLQQQSILMRPPEPIARKRARLNFWLDDIYKTELLGRKDELQNLIALLLEEHERFIAIVGAPGLGKTHLAYTLAQREEIITHFSRVVPIDLRYQETLDGMCFETAEQLHVRADTEDIQETIRIHLLNQQYPLLLLFDNFEQISKEAEPLLRLWAGPNHNIHVLVTSRHILEGDWNDWILKPLPEIRNFQSVQDLLGSPAIQLFVRRAKKRARQRNIPLDASYLQVVAELCNRLDGNPLAILILADLTALRSVEWMLSQFPESYVFAGSSDDKLFALVRTSIDLLSPFAREVFIQCYIFQDGFSDHAAISILDRSKRRGRDCRPVGAALNELERHSLLNTSEIVVEGRRQVRYRMYRIIFEASRRLWQELDDSTFEQLAKPVQLARGKYYSEYAIQWAAEIHTSKVHEALQMLTLERENILATLRWSLNHDACQAARMFLAYAEYLAIYGPWDVRQEMIHGCLQLPQIMETERLILHGHLVNHYWATSKYDAATNSVAVIQSLGEHSKDDSIYGKALLEVAYLKSHKDGEQAALPLYEKTRGLFHRANDERGMSLVNRSIAASLDGRGKYREALALADRGVTYFRSKGDLVELARSVNSRGLIYWHSGEWVEGLKDFEEAENLFRTLNNVMRVAGALTNQGLALTDGEQFEKAMTRFAAADPLHIEAHNKSWLAVNRTSLGRALFEKGLLPEAMEVLESALQLSMEGQYLEDIALCSIYIAKTLHAQDKLEEALSAFQKARTKLTELYPNGNRRVLRFLVSFSKLHLARNAREDARSVATEAWKMAINLGIGESDSRPAMRRDMNYLRKTFHGVVSSV
jgi:tetratricopeptide (TPR) repeat protein